MRQNTQPTDIKLATHKTCEHVGLGISRWFFIKPQQFVQLTQTTGFYDHIIIAIIIPKS